jgi:Uma2 family endonuclease
VWFFGSLKKEKTMALPHDNRKVSVEEYFRLRESDPIHRYEYVDGEVYMMTGGSVRHSRIGLNLCYILEGALSERPCVVYNSDACFQVAEDSYVCPDVSVSCDPRDSDERSEEEELKTIRYPCFVAEVLSPGTKSLDLDEKSTFYQDYPTMQEFLLVDTKTPKVRLYRRESNDRWTVYILSYKNEVELTSLGVSFPVAALYKKTRFANYKVE